MLYKRFATFYLLSSFFVGIGTWVSLDSSIMAENSYVELLDTHNNDSSNGDLLQWNIELEKLLQVANSRVLELNSKLEAMNIEKCKLVSDLTEKSRGRFKILKWPININYLNTIDDRYSFINKIVKVCCIFTNLLPSVVPLD